MSRARAALGLCLAAAVGAAALAGACLRTTPVNAAGSRGLLAAGATAPDFSARDQQNGLRTLREFRGRAVVLYFYPRDETPGCTREACAFRDAWDRLSAAGAQVVGVSQDTVESHRAFAASHRLPFPLLADTDGSVCARYGVSSTLGMAARVTYLVDAQGVVRRVFPAVDPAVHVDEVIAAVRALAPTP